MEQKSIQEQKSRPWLKPGIVLLAVMLLLVLLTWENHKGHFISALPFLILLLCPAMHLFMHKGHGKGHGKGH